MQGERRGAGEGMGAWLDERERQMRLLEAENRELRRQLDALRQGIGIALVIEGRLVPLTPTTPAAATGPMPATATHQSAESLRASWPFSVPVAASAAAHQVQQEAWPPHRAPGSDPYPHMAGQSHPYAPLAETPEQLPVVGPLAPRRPIPHNPPHPATSAAWADPPTLWLNSAPQTAARPSPARRTTSPSHPLWDANHQPSAEHNPYTDSFLL